MISWDLFSMAYHFQNMLYIVCVSVTNAELV